MLKKFALLFVFTMSISNAYAQEGNGYKGAKWGMTLEEVKKFFGEKLSDCSHNYDWLECEMKDVGNVKFNFDEDSSTGIYKLYNVVFTPEHSNYGYSTIRQDDITATEASQYNSAKELLLNALKSKYGDGLSFEQRKEDPITKSETTGYVWLSGDNEIRLTETISSAMVGSEQFNMNDFKLEYTSKTHVDKETEQQDAQKKKELEEKAAKDLKDKKSALNGID